MGDLYYVPLVWYMMNKITNFRFVWYNRTDFFSYYNTCKEPLMGDFRLKDAFQGGFQVFMNPR